MSTLISLLISLAMSFMMENPQEDTQQIIAEENCKIQLQQKTWDECNV
ncbi:hypothetical protein RM545_11680 [Zunongwangia sp. F260]|uniref:Uncharacterized protein n=1 Tax=Autumnicola lenta TaxID=3075593 RepID=A0ABU3CM14_9FLAO|nr:hypothetical protein [Zunongwangia sp. F260]MDT0647351.1 hypothetical protein [Zunongwangia sp. F260]